MIGDTNAQVKSRMVYNQAGSFTITNGINTPYTWTCTISGDYIVVGSMETHSAPEGVYIMGLGINNTNGGWTSQVSGSGDVRLNATRVYGLTAGQIISLSVYTSVTSASNTALGLTIARLS